MRFKVKKSLGLSHVPSQLIRDAIKDLKKTARQPGYKINMAVWHSPTQRNCYVCLAGAVLAAAHRFPRQHGLSPGCIDDIKDYCALLALDWFQRGSVRRSLMEMGIPENPLPEKVEITPYDKDPKAFVRDMLGLANMLESVGL